MTTAIPTIAVFPEEKLTLSQKIEKWVWQYCRSLEENYKLRWSDSSFPIKFRMEFGRKYIKVIHQDERDGVYRDAGVHSFVNKNTGEVYKPASWKSPHTKYVRFDLRIISHRQKLHDPHFTDWAGGYLYLR